MNYCRQTLLDDMSYQLIQSMCFFYPDIKSRKISSLIICPRKKKVKLDFCISKSMVEHLKTLCMNIKENNFDKILKNCVLSLNEEFSDVIFPWTLHEDGWFFTSVKKENIFNSVIKYCLDDKEHKPEYSEDKHKMELICVYMSKGCDMVSDLRSILFALYLKKQSNRMGANCHVLILSDVYDEVCKQFSNFVNGDEFINNNISEELHGKIGEKEGYMKSKYPQLFTDKVSLIQLCNDEDMTRFAGADLHALKTTFFAQMTSVLLAMSLEIIYANWNIQIVKCVHVCSSKLQTTAKQTELFQKIVSKVDNITNEQVVLNANTQSTTFLSEFFENRCNDIKDSYEAKEFDVMENESGTKDLIVKTTNATMSLEMLQVSPNTVVNSCINTKATFILYNYARLSMLLSTYQQNVKTGGYSSLPNLEKIDFNLREEAEWLVVREGLWLLRDKLENNIKSHKMVDFLHRISTLASSFYSRHHVLCQNLPHLLPVMYARIYLIKAILCAMQKLFDALNVTPIQNM